MRIDYECNTNQLQTRCPNIKTQYGMVGSSACVNCEHHVKHHPMMNYIICGFGENILLEKFRHGKISLLCITEKNCFDVLNFLIGKGIKSPEFPYHLNLKDFIKFALDKYGSNTAFVYEDERLRVNDYKIFTRFQLVNGVEFLKSNSVKSIKKIKAIYLGI